MDKWIALAFYIMAVFFFGLGLWEIFTHKEPSDLTWLKGMACLIYARQLHG